jgi:hypothetical protein
MGLVERQSCSYPFAEVGLVTCRSVAGEEGLAPLDVTEQCE